MPFADARMAPLDRMDAAFRRRRTAVTWLLILAALLLRAVLYLQVTSGPLGALHRWEQSDMHHFDAWARAVAAGDLASATIPVPVNLPQEQVARDYLATHATDPAHGAPDPARALWDRWLGDGRFYQEPLYPYLVAALYRAAPEAGPRAVMWFQMLIGVLTVLAVRRIAERRYGASAGLFAATGALAAGPVLFFESLLLRESLITFAGVALVDASDRTLARGGAWRRFALGLLLGGSVLLKSPFALYGLLLTAALAWPHRRTPGIAVRSLLPFAGGWALAMLPLVARNVAMGLEPLAAASGGGYTFLVANLPGADPAQGAAPGVAQFIDATRGRLGASVVAALGAWDNPMAWLGLVARKAAVLLHWPEVPNNENWALFREYAPVLGSLPLGFALVLPAAVVGALAACRRGNSNLLLPAMIATHVAMMLLFMPLGRFRAPLIPLLLPAAAFGILWLATRLFRGDFRAAGLALAVAGLVATFLWRPAPPGMGQVRASDRAATLQVWTLPLGRAAIEHERWQAAELLYQDAIDHAPKAIRRVADGHDMGLRGWDRPLAALYAEAWQGLSDVRRARGDADGAAGLERAAERLDAAATASDPATDAATSRPARNRD